MTVIEKILARRAGLDHVVPGQTVTCEVDMTVLVDLQFAHGWRQPLRLADPERVAVVMDHAVPAPTVADADGGVRARRFVSEFGISRFYDVGHHGICHQVIAEQGLARPGEVLACTDSHTCAAGAFNTAARGLGPAEVLSIICTGRTWFHVTETIRYELVGSPAPIVGGKDVFLHLAGVYGDATNHSLEFGGPGLASLPMSDRRTIATQGAEVSADFSVFEVDDVCRRWLDGTTEPGWLAADPDPDAVYAATRTIDLDVLEPQVALPGGVSGNTVPVGSIERRPVDQCFIGSCANGQLDDLRVAADVLDGRTVASGVRLIVTPASQRVFLDAVRAGYVERIVAAGGVVTNSSCGACFGYHLGLVGAGETCLTASTRNFTGRMGSAEAEIFMASPATVAASAVAGHIVDPRQVTGP